ncbi:MAG: hypothetical protein Q6365_011645 [Candidatus Sigynarchaeota archaeon]
MPAKPSTSLCHLPREALLHAFFFLSGRNKKEYRGFVQVPDLYLACAGLTGFGSPEDWQSYLDAKDTLLQKALSFPCMRHVNDPPMIPDELEFFDLKSIKGAIACPICGTPESRFDANKVMTCIACEKEVIVASGCDVGHVICKDCLALHLDKPACPAYQAGEKCHGRDCTLLR